MKAYIYLTFIILTLSLTSCVNDKPSTTEKTNQSLSSANEAASAQTKQNSRPTENMKVNRPESRPQKIEPKQAQAVEPREYKSTDPTKGKTKMQNKQNTKLEKSLKHYGKLLPSACELVTAEFIAEVIGDVNASEILVKDGSGKNAVDGKACFFKWDDKGNPNGGVLVQVQRNSIPDEFPDWAAYHINGKLNQGDQTADGSVTHRYKKFPNMGVAGAYNYNLARYTWRIEDDHVFLIAFNLESSEAEQLIWAEKIGRKVMKKFNSLNRS